MTKLKKEIDEEKETKIMRRLNEKEQAQKVIQENEVAKIKQMTEKEREREAENKSIEEYNKMLDL